MGPPQLDLHLLSWLFLLLLDFKSTTTKNILCLFPIKFFLQKKYKSYNTLCEIIHNKKKKEKKNTTKTNSFICRSCCLFSFLVPSNPLSSFSLLIQVNQY